MARVESPAGGSTLITWAPMSASNIAQYGPAITWVASTTTMPSSNVAWDIDGPVGTLTLARPQARNALTWEMYDAIVEACELVDAAPVRVLIIRGSGGAFSSGTDITQFADLLTGDDGLAYERRIGAVVERLAGVRVPTIASVDGVAVGGGCAIAVACDLRICSDSAAFGVPVARTLGNCLSLENTARLANFIGPGRVADLLMTGRLVTADEALAWGLATTVVPAAELESPRARWRERWPRGRGARSRRRKRCCGGWASIAGRRPGPSTTWSPRATAARNSAKGSRRSPKSARPASSDPGRSIDGVATPTRTRIGEEDGRRLDVGRSLSAASWRS